MPDLIGKLKILAFSSPKFELGGPPVGVYIAMFNPESFSIDHKVNYDMISVPGRTSSEPKFRNIETQRFSFDFIIDGTGASGEKREVFADVTLFKYVVGYFGEIHRPHYLLINWGTFIIKCVLDRMDIRYELFRANGTPLRASIRASFIEHTENLLESLIANRSSPDLTHVRVVKEGDSLPLLSHEIYGNSAYYMEIARVNKINNFRKLKVGDEIFFPPINKTEE